MIKLKLDSISAERHYLTVKGLVQTRIEKVLKKGSILQDKVRLTINADLRFFLTDLLTDTSLHNLITASPVDIQNIIHSVRNYYPDFVVPKSSSNLILRNIFISHCYDNEFFDKLSFIRNLNIDTCVYCNRNYIYCLSKASKIKPPIDHFYPKSIYPFLAVSYYNLIPSCQTCNGFGAKEEKDPVEEELLSPYLIENDNFKFTYRIKSINFLNPLLDKNSVEVIISNNLPGHLAVFRLDKLYEQHSDHIIEMIIKSKVEYSSKYRAYLASYKGLIFSDNDINRLILGNYSQDEEVHKRPLSKMYKDIGKELKILI